MAGRIRNHEDAGDAEISDFRDFKSDCGEEGVAVLCQDLCDRNYGIVWKNSQNDESRKSRFRAPTSSAQVIVRKRRMGGPHAARSPARPKPYRIVLQGRLWPFKL